MFQLQKVPNCYLNQQVIKNRWHLISTGTQTMLKQ